MQMSTDKKHKPARADKALRDRRSGQALLIAVLALGGAILGATSIAGLLMLYQIRATTDTESSAKAIFAADSGVEWALYSFFKPPQPALPTFANGAAVTVICSDNGTPPNQLVACDGSAGAPESAISKGTYLSARRAFFVDLASATGTLP